jgi:hypothetical protein
MGKGNEITNIAFIDTGNTSIKQLLLRRNPFRVPLSWRQKKGLSGCR